MALHTSETLHLHYMKSEPAGGGCNYGWTADFRFKLQVESSHAQNLYMVLMLFSSSRQALQMISGMLCGQSDSECMSILYICWSLRENWLWKRRRKRAMSEYQSFWAICLKFSSVCLLNRLYFMMLMLKWDELCIVSKAHENTVFTWLISLDELLLSSISLHFPKTAEVSLNPLTTNQTLILCKGSLLWSWSLDTGF